MKTIQKNNGNVEITTNGIPVGLVNPESTIIKYKSAGDNSIITIGDGIRTLFHIKLSELTEIAGVPFSGTIEEAYSLLMSEVFDGSGEVL